MRGSVDVHDRAPPDRSAPASLARERLLSTAAGNLVLALALIALAVGLLPALDALAEAAGGGSWSDLVWISSFHVVIPALVGAGLVSLAQPARLGLRRALQVAGAGYLVIGILLAFTGIPGYVRPDSPMLFIFWPGFLIWLHACSTGVGSWPCPSR